MDLIHNVIDNLQFGTLKRMAGEFQPNGWASTLFAKRSADTIDGPDCRQSVN